VISELGMIPHAQFIGIFVINILAKFHVSRYKKLHIMSHYLSLFFSSLSYMKIAPFAAYYVFNAPNLKVTSFKFGL
jgi:hypothetical protein